MAIASFLGAFVVEGCRALCVVGVGWHNLPSGVRGGLRGWGWWFLFCGGLVVVDVVFDVWLEWEFKGYLMGLMGVSAVFFCVMRWPYGSVVGVSCDVLRRYGLVANGIGRKVGGFCRVVGMGTRVHGT